jgi:hypothetical protein
LFTVCSHYVFLRMQSILLAFSRRDEEARLSLTLSHDHAGLLGSAAFVGKRVLFIGNSLTYWAGGQDVLWREWGFDAHEETVPGATLAQIWKIGEVQKQIRDGAWDVVVLQDDPPEYKTSRSDSRERWVAIHEQFERAVAKFIAAIREAGAVPVVFMTHAYRRLAHTSLLDICMAHKLVEQAHKVAIAPAGLAHQLAFERDESCPLLDPDEEHPTIAGRWLNAVTIGAVMLGAERACHLPAGSSALGDEEQDFLREAAMDALRDWDLFPIPCCPAKTEVKSSQHLT